MDDSYAMQAPMSFAMMFSRFVAAEREFYATEALRFDLPLLGC
jgi:hypothetical protein